MSSWKKVAKSTQKIHKERHQPQSRKHLGLLEKKYDYVIRAKDYNQKQVTLKLLRKQVLNKNPDEFYFSMINSQTGSNVSLNNKNNEKFSDEQIKLMETQDLKYITYKRNLETKKVEKLHSSLHVIDAANETRNKHTFFVEDSENMKNFNLVTKLKTHPQLLNRRINRPKVDTLKKLILPNLDELTISKIEQQKRMAYKELYKRINREKSLSIVQQTMEIKQALKKKNLIKPKQIFCGSKDCAPIYKWKFERKK